MKVKQTVKHFALLSIITVSIAGCSSTQDIEEQVASEVVIIEPVTEQPKEKVSAVISNGLIDIPILEDAKVFADFSDKLPAVINYFTSASEEEVIDFYQQAFGESLSQERKRGRLTLKYQEAEKIMRVVISPQNNKRQVDVMIENRS